MGAHLSLHQPQNMLYVTLANATKSLPMIGFGTCCRRSSKGKPLIDSTKSYLSMGGRHIDTAHIYGNHKDLAIAIRESNVPREELWITSKVWTGDIGKSNHPFGEPNSTAYVWEQVNQALEELQLEYLDLMLLHWPEHSIAASPRDEVLWQGLIEAKESGKVRNIGVSNYNMQQIKALERSSGVRPSVNQIPFHPWSSNRIKHVAQKCLSMNVQVQAYHSLKAAVGHDTETRSLAKAKGASETQVLLRWALDQGVVVIPGATSEDHIRDNLYLPDVHVSSNELGTV